MYLFPNSVLKQNKTCKKSKIWIELITAMVFEDYPYIWNWIIFVIK